MTKLVTYIIFKAIDYDEGGDALDKLRFISITFLILILLTSTTLLYDSGRTAHAGYFTDMYNNIKEFTELPSEINEIKNSYQQTLQELDRARLSTEMYQKQNADLAEQNQQLTKMVEQLQAAEAARERRAERIKTIVITGLALLAGYFVLTRALRYGMSRTNRL